MKTYIVEITEEALLDLYSAWSEEFYAASFINPNKSDTKSFLKWLKEGAFHKPPYQDYEQKFLEMFEEAFNELATEA